MIKTIFNGIGAVIVIGVIVIGLFYIVNSLDPDKKYYNIDSTWSNCIGTVTQIDHGKNGAGKVKYFYKGKWYEEHSLVNLGSKILGEKYSIKVNPIYPDRYVPLDWKPVFTSDEATIFTTGVVNKISKKYALRHFINTDSLSSDIIVFSYSVDGAEYKQVQCLAPNYRKSYPYLTAGQSYEVEYWDDDPDRAIIYLDKPAPK